METVKTRTYEPFYWLTEDSQTFLSRGYLQEGQGAKERIRNIADRAEEILGEEGFADKFYTYMSKGYYSLSTPVWTNFGTDRGFPISCFGSTPTDNMASILYTASEVGMMSKYGGGTSGYFGHLRPRGSEITNNGQSSGAVHFVKLFEQMTDTVSQGSSRRGRFAAYLPIDHPDIEEFLEIGVEGNDIQDVNHAVTVTNDWMKEMIAGDQEKREIWAKVLQRRVEMGYPYIFFTDTVNENKPEWYKDYPITHSNLCSEIALPDNEEWSFVCNLSSMNVLHYDEWKDTDAVETM
ncbi:MAG TPA: ribonucleotide-diphosphate reductase subunit alpha, partial [Atopostipes sp.]|nr:ribonucleotide-diphosphate reductase subunit alpha [Atopostipes sp.]